jgi:hypothetical protein
LVWASEHTVTLPKDLRTFLEQQDACRDYRGPNTPTGIGLWGVYQTHNNHFAKIAYGCSWSLTSYVMAVKDGKQWKLIPPKEYFAPFSDGANQSQGALPLCSELDMYNIPAAIESFCIKADGTAQANTR